MSWRLFLCFLCLFSLSAVAAPRVGSEAWRLERLNRRYTNFFERQRQEEAWQARRRAGAAVVTASRKEWQKEMEKARESFAKRKAAEQPPGLSEARLRFIAHKQEELEEHKIARQRYQTTVRHVEKIEKEAKHIPEMREYHLDQ